MSFKITILGSSGAMPAYGRFPSSQLVEIQNERFLVDCGEGAQIQLMQAQQSFHRINHILISHLHGDHFLGLMGLLFSMHLNHRENDLHLYSHKGLDEIVITTLRHTRSATQFKVHFHQLTAGLKETIYENKHLTIETIPLSHKIDCSGFLFREKQKPRRIDKNELPEGLTVSQLAGLKKGEDVKDQQGKVLYKNKDLTLPPKRARSYAYCSDTQYNESMFDQLHKVDVLYHETTFMEADRDKAIDTKHSTASDAARTAKACEAGKLLIGHFSARYRELEPLLEEARIIFKETYLAREQESISISE